MADTDASPSSLEDERSGLIVVTGEQRSATEGDDGVRITTELRKRLGLGRAVVATSWALHDDDGWSRPRLEVKMRPRRGGGTAAGAAGRWRHGSIGVTASAAGGTSTWASPPACSSPTRPGCAAAPTARRWRGCLGRHDSAYSRDFEDLVVHDAGVSNKSAAADRYGVSWRAGNNAYVRAATEALGHLDLLEGLGGRLHRRRQVQEWPAPREPYDDRRSGWAAQEASTPSRRSDRRGVVDTCDLAAGGR